MKSALLTILLLVSLNVMAQDTIILESYFRELKTINLELENQTFRFLFDAAAAQTYISPDIAQHNNIKGYGNSVIVRMHGEVLHYEKSSPFILKSAHTSFNHESAGIWDIMSILPKELPALDGVISLKTFEDHKLILDLSKNTLIVFKANSDIEGTLLIPRFANGLEGIELNCFIGIPFNGKTYWFLFDSGNIRPVIFSKQLAAELNLEENYPNKKVTLLLGDEKEEADYSVEDILYDGVLNFKTIANHRFLIDFPEQKIWLVK